MKMKMSTKKMTALAMCAAISYLVMVFGRIPIVLFLKFDPKDAVLAITTLIFGLVPSLLVTAVVCLVEFFTVSDTGFWGLLMNFVGSAAFIVPLATMVNRKDDTKWTALALLVSTLVMTFIMLAWNIVITPIYMKVPFAEVKKLLLPAILPFNIFKGLLNSALTFVALPIVPRLKKTLDLQDEEANHIGIGQVAWISSLLLVSALIIYYALNSPMGK